MNATIVERRFRLFLLIVVEGLCVGTVIELWLAKHIKLREQLIPFVLCGIGFLSVLAVLVRPGRITIWFMRRVMIVIILGSLLGMYFHLSSNFELESEIQSATAATSDIFFASLMGAAPVLAPGLLALAGTLALAATYYHPALGKRNDIALPASL